MSHHPAEVKQVASEYVSAFSAMLRGLDTDALQRVVDVVRQARERGSTIYVAGNGGSASTASHWVNDLGKATKADGVPPLRVMSLNDNVSWLTALGNDEGYDRVFSGQLENFAQPGDVLLLISASGNSPNLLRAAELGRARGLATVGFLGFDGGLLRHAVDEVVLLPSGKGAYGLVESGHSLLGHVLTTCLARAAGSVGPASQRLTTHVERPRQAVIFAGGRGTRLGALTATRPKPMIEFHGRPFLEYQIEQLREQGFTRVMLLLGYQADVIRDHFGDGSRFGVAISYSVSDPDELTVGRIRRVRHLLDPVFLLLYCDNYWPLQMERLWERFAGSGAAAMVTVYSNRDGYSRDSVRVGADGVVEVFDRGRTAPDLSGVEISYALVTREALELLPEQDALFEEAVYPALVETRRLAAFVSDHRYYSVGSPDRLPLTEAFFARRPAILLDRDGVLNERPPRAHYVREPGEFRWLPGAREALGLLNEAGYRTIVVSNQAGIGRGVMSEADLAALHAWVAAEARAGGGRIDAFYHCPHDWNAGCDCRKPAPGLLFRAQRDFHLDLTRTPFVGDDSRDGEAAGRAGCPFLLASGDASLLDHVHTLLMRSTEADYVHP